MAKQRCRDWLERIKAVEREYIAARRAVDDFLIALEQGTTQPPPKTKVRDVHAMSDLLEGTYLIRLIAAFETGLRNYWATIRPTKPQAKDLIDSIAARRGVPDDVREHVHDVREYRNSLVHETDDEVIPVEVVAARSHLCIFFARLPDEW